MYYQSSGSPLQNTKRISSRAIQFSMNYEDLKISLMNQPSPVYKGFTYGPIPISLHSFLREIIAKSYAINSKHTKLTNGPTTQSLRTLVPQPCKNYLLEIVKHFIVHCSTSDLNWVSDRTEMQQLSMSEFSII